MVFVCRFVAELWRRPTCRLLIAVVIAGSLGVAVSHAFIGSVAVIEGSSMAPNYQPGSSVYAAPISTKLERGDVVVLDDGRKDYAVKRIIGLPGETVQLWRGAVFINRKLLIEPYLPAHTYTVPNERGRRGAAFILGDREYFVLGDNRPRSVDGRVYGPVERSQIKRRVLQPNDFICAYFGNYTLPEPGQTVIQPLRTRKLASNTL
jgi:signal peptidase I